MIAAPVNGFPSLVPGWSLLPADIGKREVHLGLAHFARKQNPIFTLPVDAHLEWQVRYHSRVEEEPA
jgi:hypothetical protein